MEPRAGRVRCGAGTGGRAACPAFAVVTVGLWEVATHSNVVTDWSETLTTEHGNPPMMVAIALIAFPKPALGLSGFETGVAVMPHFEGSPGNKEERPAGASAGPGNC